METIIFGQWWRSHQSLARKGLRIFRFCVMPWKDEREPAIKYCLGRQVDVVQEFHHHTELWRQLMVSQWNSSGIFSQNSPHCSSATKSKSSCLKWAIHQNNLKDGSSSCRCSTTSHGDLKTMNSNVSLTPTSFSIYARRFPPGRWSFFRPGSEKKWYSTYIDRPEGEWDRVAEVMMIKFGESGHPVFWATSSSFPRNVQKQRRWKIINTLLCQWWYDWTFFRTIISVNQLSIYGAVSDLCDEIQCLASKNGETRAGRTIWPIVWASKFVDKNTYTFDQWSCARRFIAKVQRTSGKAITTKSRDLNLYWCRIPVGQHFMTKDAGEFSPFLQNQWHVASTLCQETTNHLTQKGLIRGDTKIDPCWKSQPVTCKVNIEWKLELNL